MVNVMSNYPSSRTYDIFLILYDEKIIFDHIDDCVHSELHICGVLKLFRVRLSFIVFELFI
jgi:hypothetical protein